MNIFISPEIFLRLCVIEDIAGDREFSGYGFVNVENRDGDKAFTVYDIELLDIGSPGFTEFSSAKILKILDREDANRMKLWFHRHPFGNGVPGPHNWSETDNSTCTNEPLGCPDPDKVGWALAMVLTPKGWVGRIDQFKDGGHKVTHIPVHADIDFSFVEKTEKLLKEQIETEKNEKNKVVAQEDCFVDFADPDYFKIAHSAIDEADAIIQTAEFQIDDGFIEEAIDSISWAYDIAQRYKSSPYLKHKAMNLLRKVTQMKRKLRRITT